MKPRIGDRVKHINHPQYGVGVVVNEGITGVEVKWENKDRAHYHLFQHLNRYFDSVAEALGEKTVQQKHPSKFTDEYYNTPEKKPETGRIETFWIVWSPSSGGNPQAKHPYEDKARHEAERLSKKQPDRVFHVLKCIGTVKTTNNPTTEWY